MNPGESTEQLLEEESGATVAREHRTINSVLCSPHAFQYESQL